MIDIYADSIQETPNNDALFDAAPKETQSIVGAIAVKETPVAQNEYSNFRALILEGLTWWTTDSDLLSVCLDSGIEKNAVDMADISFLEFRVNGKSKGIAQIVFASNKDAVIAKAFFDKLELHSVKPVSRIVYYDAQKPSNFMNQSNQLIHAQNFQPLPQQFGESQNQFSNNGWMGPGIVMNPIGTTHMSNYNNISDSRNFSPQVLPTTAATIHNLEPPPSLPPAKLYSIPKLPLYPQRNDSPTAASDDTAVAAPGGTTTHSGDSFHRPGPGHAPPIYADYSRSMNNNYNSSTYPRQHVQHAPAAPHAWLDRRHPRHEYDNPREKAHQNPYNHHQTDKNQYETQSQAPPNWQQPPTTQNRYNRNEYENNYNHRNCFRHESYRSRNEYEWEWSSRGLPPPSRSPQREGHAHWQMRGEDFKGGDVDGYYWQRQNQYYDQNRDYRGWRHGTDNNGASRPRRLSWSRQTLGEKDVENKYNEDNDIRDHHLDYIPDGDDNDVKEKKEKKSKSKKRKRSKRDGSVTSGGGGGEVGGDLNDDDDDEDKKKEKEQRRLKKQKRHRRKVNGEGEQGEGSEKEKDDEKNRKKSRSGKSRRHHSHSDHGSSD